MKREKFARQYKEGKKSKPRKIDIQPQHKRGKKSLYTKEKETSAHTWLSVYSLHVSILLGLYQALGIVHRRPKLDPYTNQSHSRYIPAFPEPGLPGNQAHLQP